MLNALKADAKTVDLRGLAGHFYELAGRVLELFEEEEIVDVLCEVRFGLLFAGQGGGTTFGGGGFLGRLANGYCGIDVQEEGG